MIDFSEDIIDSLTSPRVSPGLARKYKICSPAQRNTFSHKVEIQIRRESKRTLEESIGSTSSESPKTTQAPTTTPILQKARTEEPPNDSSMFKPAAKTRKAPERNPLYSLKL